MAVVAVAVMSKQNFPLYLKTANTKAEPDLQFQYLVHTSLDVIDEKVSTISSPKVTNDPREPYLGLLYPSEEYKVYGYATNTRVKFVMVTENSSSQSKDSKIREYFKELHDAYKSVLCNPFYTPGTNIKMKSFERVVSGIFQKSKE